ncbi:biopolymer transporter ExbD [Psychrobium sp. 1_MG-2023]|uniref:ExbD/TolR family protein n=1 Tax=Psychrobium sp. 1_MG-2023 TaxID=3062624 RepID=UPI000C3290B7|nr:biopolymer transporter ExbD [Psychrobium sp. 1_MG-2023]MDP2559526.1 biopolymer transporter ExbD [Psychrobium sp. 1_MG-2023]PKF59366.1 RNA polymerase subunit sigma-70 [Alteromonadales bacterium alter-6D02]
MKKSARAMRIERHHKRMSKTSKLSLVSLMDIFTILVFFLIVNSSTVEVLQADKSIKLPQSVSKTLAEDNLLLLINDQELILQGKKVVDIEQVIAGNTATIAELASELEYHKQRQQGPDTEDASITIMGDQAVEYAILKKVLKTCSEAGFGNISLAVEKTAANNEGVNNAKANP